MYLRYSIEQLYKTTKMITTAATTTAITTNRYTYIHKLVTVYKLNMYIHGKNYYPIGEWCNKTIEWMRESNAEWAIQYIRNKIKLKSIHINVLKYIGCSKVSLLFLQHNFTDGKEKHFVYEVLLDWSVYVNL